MNREFLMGILDDFRAGSVTAEDVCTALTHLPFEEISFAKIDHHRELRTGLPEVIYAAGKTVEQVTEIFAHMTASGANVLATRADEACFAAVKERIPQAVYHALARCITLTQRLNAPLVNAPLVAGKIAVVCAGTSDLPVAEEAAVTAEHFGVSVTRISDVGVAGIHRLLAHLPLLREANVIIACAGMEGALPSVIGGLVGVPVIAVPTSVGYGASFGGVTALLGMLTSCAPNTTVVNIDNGFGAAYAATLMVRQICAPINSDSSS